MLRHIINIWYIYHHFHDSCVHDYVYTFVCVCTHLHVCRHIEVNVRMPSSIVLHLIFWNRVSSWAWNSLIPLAWISSGPLGVSCLHIPSTKILSHFAMPKFSLGCWGSEFKSSFSCLCKHSSHWAISHTCSWSLHPCFINCIFICMILLISAYFFTHMRLVCTIIATFLH